jgi:class 3 adenylate cyclase
MELDKWLGDLGLEEYVELFRRERIDTDILGSLSEGDLKEIGIATLGDRKRLIAGIQVLQQNSDDQNGPTSDPQHGSDEQQTARSELHRLIQGTFLIGERKLVTILFADIAGSTALTERLGAEEALSALQPTLKAMMAAVRQYNGTVNKVQGDGIMAIFGAPITYEDHALRASLAAMDMQRRLDRINSGNPTEQGEPIKVRVGLHSGDVIVKAIHNDLSIDYDAVGPTVNLANRMEQSAEPGEIRLTEDTLKLISPSLSAEAVGPVPVKGFSEPVQIFRLSPDGLVDLRLGLRRVSVTSTFIGRENEIAVLERVWQSVREGSGVVVALGGEPGVGKSRLIEEFISSNSTIETGLIWASSKQFGGDNPWY